MNLRIDWPLSGIEIWQGAIDEKAEQMPEPKTAYSSEKHLTAKFANGNLQWSSWFDRTWKWMVFYTGQWTAHHQRCPVCKNNQQIRSVLYDWKGLLEMHPVAWHQIPIESVPSNWCPAMASWQRHGARWWRCVMAHSTRGACTGAGPGS